MARIVIFTDLMEDHCFSRAAGAYRIATELRRAGFETQVIDFFTHMGLEVIFKLIHKYVDRDTLWVGWSSTFFKNIVDKSLNSFEQNRGWGFPYPDKIMKGIFDEIRLMNPDTKIVYGGARSPYEYPSGVDYFITGYGDRGAVELAKHLDNPDYPIKATPSTNHLDSLVINGDADYFPTEFIRTGTIEWHESDFLMPNETLTIELSRGCIFNCAFCSYKMKGRKKNEYLKDPEVIYEEFMSNYEKYQITSYIYSDDTHNDNVEKLEILKSVYDRLPFRIRFSTYLRADLLNAFPHTIELLGESGLYGAFFGIETFNHETGKLIGKGLHPDRMKDTLYRVKSIWGDRVTTDGGFILGLPKEDIASMNSTIDWLMHPDNPLDHFSIMALMINDPKILRQINTRIAPSMIDLRYEELGYKKTVQEFDHILWDRGDCTYTGLDARATEIMRNSVHRRKPSAFGRPRIKSLGFSDEQLNRSVFEVFTTLNIKERVKQFVNMYQTKLLEQ